MCFEILQKEMIKALKEGNKFRRLTLSTLIAAIKRTAIDSGNRDNITDDMVIQVLKKERKNFIDAIEKFPNMSDEKKNEYKNKTLIIDEFIPTEICDEKRITEILHSIAQEEGIEITKNNQGKFMKILKADYNVNMKIANEVFMGIVEWGQIKNGLSKIGVSIVEPDGNFKNISDVLEEVAEKWNESF